MILATHGFLASSIGQFDADAVAFFNRVTTAGGTLSATEQNAINTLVIQMKTDGIWTKMKAIYPMVGASGAACAQNLKSSSFTGSFTSGWTFASTGVTPNGTSDYMDTNLTPSVSLLLNNSSISVYLRTNSTGLYCDIGSANTAGEGQINIFPRFMDETYYRIYEASSGTMSNTNSQGWYLANRVSSSETRNFKNSTLNVKTVASTTINSSAITLAAGAGSNRTIASFSNRENAFASIGDGLTDTEAANFYTAVQAFQTTLSRNV
jgi:hypothetical protein